MSDDDDDDDYKSKGLVCFESLNCMVFMYSLSLGAHSDLIIHCE